MHTKILLTPGPVNVHNNVIKSLQNHTLLHHRSSEFGKILEEIVEKIKESFEIPPCYDVLLMGASGTGMIDSMLSVVKHTQKKGILIIRNGHFGQRLCTMAKDIGLTVFEKILLPHQDLCENDIEKMISDNSEIGSIAFVHHETSLGAVNDFFDRIKIIADKRNLLFLVDMVSSLGSEKFSFKQSSSPDIAVTVSGKALASFAGIGIMIIHKKCFDFITSSENHYLNPIKYKNAWDKDKQLPFTPPIVLFPALLEALKIWQKPELSKLSLLHEFIQMKGFVRVPVVNPSLTTATYTYSEKQEHDFLRLQNAFELENSFIYQNKNYHRNERQFQVSTMGYLEYKNLMNLVERVKQRL